MNEQSRMLMPLQFASGSIAACSAVTITNPFDLLKTRRQLLNELQKSSSPSNQLVLQRSSISLTRIWQVEGLRGLQKGLSAAYIYQVLMNGTRFMIYEPLRLSLMQWIDDFQDYRQNSKVALESSPKILRNHWLGNAVAGAIAGGSAALIGSPFNLIKTRLQSYSPHFATGHQHGYAGIREAIHLIRHNEGWLGFYKGVSASMLRTTAGSAAQLASYDAIKPILSKGDDESVIVHLEAAMVSGVIASLVMNPFDVVMTRLYNQSPGNPLYSGIFDCAMRTVRAEGITALWKGLVPHFIRVGPHTVLTLVLLEQVRSHLRPLFIPPPVN